VASFSARFSSLTVSRPTWMSPPVPETVGIRLMAASTADFSAGIRTPARSSSARPEPSAWPITADSRCTGSMYWWSPASARLCASASTCWNWVVSLSCRIVSVTS
jgi:hypothetical protein